MDVDHAFDALADPVRREILAVLAHSDECSAGELSDRVSRVGRTAVSSHLRKLLLADLITERRTGRFRYYSLNPNGTAREVLALLQTLFQDSLAEAKRTAAARAAVGGAHDPTSADGRHDVRPPRLSYRPIR